MVNIFLVYRRKDGSFGTGLVQADMSWKTWSNVPRHRQLDFLIEKWIPYQQIQKKKHLKNVKDFMTYEKWLESEDLNLCDTDKKHLLHQLKTTTQAKQIWIHKDSRVNLDWRNNI